MKKPLMLSFLFSLSLLSVACGDTTADVVECGAGQSVNSGGQDYCVYQSPITEEGFRCPSALASAFRLGTEIVVCSSIGDKDLISTDVIEDLIEVVPEGVRPVEGCATLLCESNQACLNGACQPKEQAQCQQGCAEGCAAPEFQPCGSDGNFYCSECNITCQGLTVESDRSVCESPNDACDECGDACVAPEFQPCGSDGNFYCSECNITCQGLTVESDRTMCE